MWRALEEELLFVGGFRENIPSALVNLQIYLLQCQCYGVSRSSFV